jgi:DNA primase
LDRAPLAKSYAILRERIMQSDLTEDIAKEDFYSTLKKLEQIDLKDQMTEIAARIAAGQTLEGDVERYRQLMTKLK